DDLFEIAYGRGAGSLHAAMREKASAVAGLGKVAERLEALRKEADFQRPYEFFAHFLSGYEEFEGVRAKFISRLGPEAAEILDEFLSFCMAAERSGVMGLAALLALLEGAAPDIRREMDQGRDEVRIMTVHAAKGLEAPIVFL